MDERCTVWESVIQLTIDCVYIRKPKKGRFYTCIFIEKGFRKALRTYNFKKKAVFVCAFRADRGKYDQNAHIKSMKKPFSYVRLSQIIVPHRGTVNHEYNQQRVCPRDLQ